MIDREADGQHVFLCIFSMRFVFYILGRRSVVGGHGGFRGPCGWSWATLWPGGGLESLLGPMWTILGRPAELSGRSWAALGTYVSRLVLYCGPCGQSWATLGPSGGGLGPLLGLWTVLGRSLDLLAVLGRSRGLCERSWAALGASLDVLGGDQAGKLPFPNGSSISSGSRIR